MTGNRIRSTRSIESDALLILLEGRDRIGGLFGTWDEIEEIRDASCLAAVRDAYRAIDQAIIQLGGPTIQTVYEITHGVLGDVPDRVGDEPLIAQAILQHCAAVAEAMR